MATVTVPAEFFRGELRVYGDWREAFARELLQNATDANPSKIDVEFSTVDDHGRVVFRDDGHGMSREVLEDVFFALGRTTKTGPDTIGGFGRARIIICFAQTRYRIRTGNLIVDGEGGTYTITETAEFQPGCEFIIDLLDEDASRVKFAFEYLLSTCSIKTPVTLDGYAAPAKTMPDRATRIMRDDLGRSWAKVFVRSGAGKLLVRVHGLTMFSRWLAGDDDVIVELDPARSREVLSASRDNLHGDFNVQIDKFISDLTRNRRQALRTAAAPLDVRVGGGGFMQTDAAVAEVDADADQASSNLDGLAVVAGGGSGVLVTAANAAAAANQATVRSLWADDDVVVPSEVPQLGFDVFMMADTTDARVRRLSRAWDPTSWGLRNGKRRRSVLLAWKAAVGVALDHLVQLRPDQGRVLWTVGWTFDTDTSALHKAVSPGHVLALNPVDADGKARFVVSRRQDRQRLLALAMHEACHVIVDGHDESFAGLLTDLIGEIDPAEADRIIRNASRAA